MARHQRTALAAEHPSLSHLKQAAEKLGFTCRGTQWNGYHSLYAFACREGHLFERSAANLIYSKVAAPCPHCAREAMRQRFFNMAIARGGACLEKDYLGQKVRHRIRCSEGHEWQVVGRKLLAGHWCPTCAREANIARLKVSRWSLQDLQAKAALRGGQCLATEYLGPHERHELVCARGHRWSPRAAEIMRGTWCLQCARRALGDKRMVGGLSRIQAAAHAKGGVCLDEEYRGQSARYRFRCEQGHVWKTTGQNVLNGCWCRRCFNDTRRLGIEAMQAIARGRGGQCLSEIYENKQGRLTWQCHRGHVWQTSSASVLADHWCPSCAILDRIRNKNQHKRRRYERAPGLD